MGNGYCFYDTTQISEELNRRGDKGTYADDRLLRLPASSIIAR